MAPLLRETTFERELRWAGSYLASHGSQLADFVRFSTQFQRSLLLGDYESSLNTLNQVEQQFGQSLWLIENKIALLQIAHGLEAQKIYTNGLMEQLQQTRGVIAFIVHVASVRNEVTVSPHRTVRRFTEQLDALSALVDLHPYLLFHIDPYRLWNNTEVASILRWESATSVIDYYETLLTLISFSISNDQNTQSDVLSSVVRTVHTKTGDPRLAMQLFELKGKEMPQDASQSAAVNSLNYFLTGDYDKAFNVAFAALLEYPDSPDLREIAARCLCIIDKEIDQGDSSISYRLLLRMSNILSKKKQLSDAFEELYRFGVNFSNCAWAKAIMGFAAKETLINPFASDGMLHYAASATPSLSPIQLGAFPRGSFRVNYVDALQTKYGKGPSVTYASILAGGPRDEESVEQLVAEERQLIQIYDFFQREAYREASQIANQLAQSDYEYYRRKALRLQTYSLLMLGEMEKCVDLVTSVFVHNRELQVFLPIQEIVEVLDKETRKKLKGSLSLPILYDMYCRFVNDSQTSERNYAYEDFLCDNDIAIDHPSHLASKVNQFDKLKVIHYLRYLCVEQVMDTTMAFETAQGLGEERVEICRALVNLDPQNIEIYQSEIKDVLRKSMVRRRIRQIEQTKIYVNLESIRETVSQTLKETYQRYISLLESGVPTETLSVIDEARLSVSSGNIDNLLRLILPQNEMKELLRAMVVELRDHFVSNTEHGLDGYLSIRIRHGTLLGQLRSPLEAAHLISQRDDTTDAYKPNDFWLHNLASEEVAKQALHTQLTKFSEQFDDLVREIKDEWIQIRKSIDDTGLFSFILSEGSISYFASQVSEETTFDQFLTYVFVLFSDQLEDNLSAIRLRLGVEAKTRINNYLTDLQKEIEKLSGAMDISDISYAITTARTGMQVTIDRIIEWFRVGNLVENEPFQIKEVIDVAAESVRTPSNDFEASINSSEELSLYFAGNILASFVDIFFILFENISRHAHLSGKTKADIDIKYSESVISLRVENDVDPEVDKAHVEERLSNIAEAIREGRHRAAIATEGGTGFLKISKIIKNDFGRNSDIKFGMTEDRRFFVEFSLPLLGVS